ncbi:hypothetical protein BAE44_0015074 [Dichanthelium oligosanthes]|uniref:Uncharacterized protein n=1 Tax=Dichanthelium oligosanthes TaxID=888268 RepID=A0A1E5VFM1_9POAL|nr:hypothetical protein BAE44_0015074 [Dichanthelium oligosanthes]
MRGDLDDEDAEYNDLTGSSLECGDGEDCGGSIVSDGLMSFRRRRAGSWPHALASVPAPARLGRWPCSVDEFLGLRALVERETQAAPNSSTSHRVHAGRHGHYSLSPCTRAEVSS